MPKQRKYLFDRSDWKSVITNVIAGVIAGVIGGVILPYISPNLIPSVWSFTANAARSVCGIVTTTHNIPLWILVPLVLCTGVVVVATLASFVPKQSGFDYSSFTTSVYDGIKWEWMWGEAGIHSLTARCLTCDCTLNATHFTPSNYISFSCESCGHEVARSKDGYKDHNEHTRRIKQLIDQDLRRKEMD
ncbi:MAG: hypothetical protein LH702_27240 [Phormidesmis sp. CAN_BIN44]|nr:hypothetical protein [Phormidesmis sp. CAN_BIN44]